MADSVRKFAGMWIGAFLLACIIGVQAQDDECAQAKHEANALECAFGVKPVGLLPLTSGVDYTSETDLLPKPYPTFLYPDSSNILPAAHQAKGDSIALTVAPLDADGNVDFVFGKIKIIAEGMSNARDEFDAFKALFIDDNIDIRDEVEFVNLSQGSCDLICWVNRGVEEIDPQVQIVFLKHSSNRPQLPDGSPKNPAPPFLTRDDKRFPSHALTTKTMLKTRILNLKKQYPNLKQVFLTSRSFGGWSCLPQTASYREPVGYEEGFSVKWLLEDQISGSDPEMRFEGEAPSAPWLAWGPYLWDAAAPEDHYKKDGVHPCETGTAHIATLWYDALLANTAARSWLLKNPLTPVELAAFTANVQNQNVELLWTTVSETNNHGFEVERLRLPVDAGMNSWKIIGFVQGRGTSSTPSHYRFLDAHVAAGGYQYRLKQIDFDGAFEYTPPLRVVVDGPEQFRLFQNYPNPFQKRTEIAFQTGGSTATTLEIVNMLGQTIRAFSIRPSSNDVQKIVWDGLDQAGLSAPPGLYFYKIQTGDKTYSKTLILTR